nr:MAG TPA: hypothetical protein [Caudoviricetes sp.]
MTVERHYTGGLQCLIMHRRRVKGTRLSWRRKRWHYDGH